MDSLRKQKKKFLKNINEEIWNDIKKKVALGDSDSDFNHRYFGHRFDLAY
jgi:hypothetical protein